MTFNLERGVITAVGAHWRVDGAVVTCCDKVVSASALVFYGEGRDLVAFAPSGLVWPYLLADGYIISRLPDGTMRLAGRDRDSDHEVAVIWRPASAVAGDDEVLGSDFMVPVGVAS